MKTGWSGIHSSVNNWIEN